MVAGTTQSPKISVCIPTYNYGHFIAAAIESAYLQTFTNFELLIVDNCSTDNTGEVVERYVKSDRRIKYFRNESNVGMAANFNRCLRFAAGEYVKILCADDLLEKTCLEKSVALLDNHSDISLVGCSRLLVDGDLKPVTRLSYSSKPEFVEGHEVIKKCLIRGVNFIGEPSAVLFRKNQAGRGFDPRYRQLIDLEMWFHILEQGKFAFISEALAFFRVHPEQQTRHNMLNPALLDEPFLLLEEYSHKTYLKLGAIEREYMQYLAVYSAWKLYKKHQRISRRAAIEVIKKRYHLAKFIFLYPFFKAYKFYLRSVNR